ncbi:MAG: hypothetical protein QOG64_243 [Acidimicrobiaceae bacterium]|nr:hypothetical protein [Acidimicrobiaceae bacterium]
MAGKFTIKSRTWNVITVVGIIVLFVVGFGGLFYIRDNLKPDGTTMLLFLVVLGVVTFLLFAGPGLLYPGRKRIGWIKKLMPGGTMAWIRSHMYLPALAVAAAIVHATGAPFRANLSSGKVLLAVGILVVISGYCRHHMIGLQKEALNVNVEITKLTTGQPREFRDLVTDYLENRRPLPDIEAAAEKLDRPQQVLWREVLRLSERVQRNFPREGGQRARVLHLKMWKALHPPLTIALFIVLAFHVWDTLGAKQRLFHSRTTDFAASAQCSSCHSNVFSEFSTSSMAHAQSSTIMKIQLPITLRENQLLAKNPPARSVAAGVDQQKLFEGAAKVCTNCHAQVGARLAKSDTALLPFNAANSESLDSTGKAVGGGAAVQSDGVGCIVCHTQAAVPAKQAGNGPLNLGKAEHPSDYRTQYGPLFKDPDALPVRVHANASGDNGLWNSTVSESQVCGACHDVKLDITGNGLSGVPNAKSVDLNDPSTLTDADGNFQLDGNELDFDKNGNLQDLVLQTSYDEWQDYVVGYQKRFANETRQAPHIDKPLGCTECHMPTKPEGNVAVVDHAPGVLSVPKRPYASHTFVGVDYDPDPKAYVGNGQPANALDTVLSERQALLQSAVTMQVTDQAKVAPGVFRAEVKVQNNFLGHSFPTGFAFARQFWLEVSAVDTKTGKPVCLADAAPGIPAQPPVNGNCGSGLIPSQQDPLPQCDPESVKAALAKGPQLTLKGADGTPNAKVDPNALFVKDKGVKFNAAFPVGQCDPWLANFQKILTNGDPGNTGTFQEVAFQSFLPDIVKLRTRVATGQVMAPLESVREKIGADGKPDPTSTFAILPYAFDISQVPDADLGSIVVTAKMHLRSTPPEFIRSLEAEQQKPDAHTPEGTKFNSAQLIANLRVDDGSNKNPMAQAKTGDAPLPLCEGPQNKQGATILSCVKPLSAQALGKKGAGSHTGDSLPAAFRTNVNDGLVADLRHWTTWLAVLGAFSLATGLLRRRLFRRS